MNNVQYIRYSRFMVILVLSVLFFNAQKELHGMDSNNAPVEYSLLQFEKSQSAEKEGLQSLQEGKKKTVKCTNNLNQAYHATLGEKIGTFFCFCCPCMAAKNLQKSMTLAVIRVGDTEVIAFSDALKMLSLLELISKDNMTILPKLFWQCQCNEILKKYSKKRISLADLAVLCKKYLDGNRAIDLKPYVTLTTYVCNDIFEFRKLTGTSSKEIFANLNIVLCELKKAFALVIKNAFEIKMGIDKFGDPKIEAFIFKKDPRSLFDKLMANGLIYYIIQ
jgi:hypothetical protein